VIRIGAVEYLNARPLVSGLERAPWCTVRFDVPAECARLLHAGEIDLGLVPAIELLRGPVRYDVVPGLAIACRGPVLSVALFTRVPVREIRTIALDTSSRASAGLLRLLCAQSFGIAPAYVERPPDLSAMLTDADAALLIGDPALDAPWEALGLEKIDLGQAWFELTGLPFVFAVWAARPGVLTDAVVAGLHEARDRGQRAIADIARDAARGDATREAAARRYLTDHIRYDLDDAARQGLERYLGLAVELGLAPARDEAVGIAPQPTRG